MTEAPDEVWVIDEGDPPDEDEDWRDDHEPEDDWWDDDLTGWEREEPYCVACNDLGCRECQPTRLDMWRWTLSDRLRRLGPRRRRPLGPDEPPF